MSIELSSASANILFNSVNQQRLQKKLLTNDNFEIVKKTMIKIIKIQESFRILSFKPR